MSHISKRSKFAKMFPICSLFFHFTPQNYHGRKEIHTEITTQNDLSVIFSLKRTAGNGADHT